MPHKDIKRRRAYRRDKYAENKAAGIKREWGVLDCICPICNRIRQISKNSSHVTKLSKDKDGYAIRRCRACAKIKINAKYKNKEYVRDHLNQLQRKLKVNCINYLGGKCIDCGLKYNGKNAYAFDFHHRNPEEKEFYPASKTRKFEKVKKELDKCDLLCAICHRTRHCEPY